MRVEVHQAGCEPELAGLDHLVRDAFGLGTERDDATSLHVQAQKLIATRTGVEHTRTANSRPTHRSAPVTR